jgi:hypothetical protein
MRRIFLVHILIFISFSLSLRAQNEKSSFSYLPLPSSVRVAALGGTNVSLIENDVSLVYSNPALLGTEADKHLNISYLSYIADVGVGSVTFAKAWKDKTTWGVGVNYANYGKMFEAADDNVIMGDLAATDICGNIFLSRDLITDRLRGGITAKFLYSNYYYNTSTGLGFDIGLSYYDTFKGFSISLVGKNIGRQITAYEEELSSLPWDIQLGVSKKLDHAPIRFSVTGIYLKQWKFENITGEKDTFFKTFSKHLVIGADIIPSDNLWIGLGYNVKRSFDMYLEQGNKLAGFSIGAGLKVKSFSFGCSLGQYHPSATSVMFTVSTSFAEVKL